MPPLELAERAVSALEEHDSPSLRILAGLDRDEPDSREIERRFWRALAELGVTPPSRPRALEEYADLLVEEFLAGSRTARKTLPELAWLKRWLGPPHVCPNAGVRS